MTSSGGTVQSSTRPPWALGLCDRCGFSGKLNRLKAEIYDERPNGLLVCDACLDVDNPQLQLGRLKVNDPQSLLDPRPDTGIPGSTGLFGWMPIGNPLTNIQCFVGDITVVIT
jgi:hypothetical protein